MSGISDQFTTIGYESSAWGTVASTLTRGIYQEPGNKSTVRVEPRTNTGFRPGFLGVPEDTYAVDLRGGTYPLAFDLLGKSHSLALAMAGSAPTITTPVGGTDARLHTILPSDFALRPMSIHDGVALGDGSIDHVNFLGAIATQLGINISPKGNVKVKIDTDYKTIDTAASSVTPAYPSSPYVFKDTDVTTTLGGTAICQTGIDIMIPTGAKVDRDKICAGGRDVPIVVGQIAPTGTLNFDLVDMAYIDDWLAGTSRSLVFDIVGPIIEGSLHFFLRVTLAAVKFTGDSYDRKTDDLTGQSLPWQAVDNGTDPLWKIEYQTSDTAA